MARPNVTVFGTNGEAAGTAPLPAVFTAPIRNDVVRFVHTNIRKNSRQAYGVSRTTGHRATAESWGTGRAVARIPRVGGGGTHRSGEGAYGNQCRGGRMFAPTKVYRRWNRMVNKNIRRYAVTSAVAASALPPLVQARGHKIDQVQELPLVTGDAIQGYSKASEAIATLKALNVFTDAEKVKNTIAKRAGKGKMRNRRWVQRKGPLVVFAKNEGGWKSFHNIAGVDLGVVGALNLLQLAPGGHLGRLIVWSEAAFRQLSNVFGADANTQSTTRKYLLPRPVCTNSDINGQINRDEVQGILRPKGVRKPKQAIKRNPLRNPAAMAKLRPNAIIQRKRVTAMAASGKKKQEAKKGKK